uniref:Uncharacterized protein K02A2.6-like n=1 Tax=Nicotiana tabacum TaxID=4097 RepID=A0A1S4BT91_TOBAC|nr:PREDICTED: uncharacterized protein K02A2.6-like [Nicotiana tabacum]
MNPLKCAFGVTFGKFLGFIVRHRGIEIDQAKVDAIFKMSEPKNIHELKSLQGKLVYLRRFISNLAGKCQPFSRLMKKGIPFEWDQACSNAFQSIKSYLMKPPVLAAPIPGKPLILYIAAQESKVVSPISTIRDCDIPQKAVKGQVLTDFLADHPIPDDWKLTDELPDEDVMVIEVQPPWKMYFDGAAHREGAGAGVVFVTSQGEVLSYSFTLTQHCTNNVAEYQSLILGFEMAVETRQLQLHIFGDSELVINQLLGSYEVKKPVLRRYYDYAQKLIGWLGNVTLQHVPRKENKKADALATLASTLAFLGQTQITIFQKWIMPPDENEDEESKLERLVVVVETVKVDWRQTMIDYLCYGILPEDPRRKTEIRRRAPRFLYYKDTLYRRSFEGILLHCLGEDEATQAMQQTHSGVCGSHQSGPKLHFHIKRMGYYWPTMVKDCLDFLEDARLSNIVGPLPKSSGGHLYILAATDYFSKWAEVVALKEVKKENVANFIRVNIIYHFGIPSYIITDNDKPFDNKLMTKVCELFGFKQRNSSMYYVASNGLAEAFNKTLCNLLKKVVSKSKRDWHDRMEEALWAYRTTHRTPTQATPYSLVYGVEAVLPLERQIPSL